MADVPAVGEPVSEAENVILSGLPMLAATGAQLAEIEDDYVITFTRPITGHVVKGGKTLGVAQNRPVAEILVSRVNLTKIGKLINDLLEKTPDVQAGSGA